MKPVVDGLTDVLAGAPLDYAPDDNLRHGDLQAPPAQRGLLLAYTLLLVAAALAAAYGAWFAAGVLAATVTP
ncbi:hypothetical protein EET67_04965 [Pseudaminobacter arsenicus]|uniref:Uncharacterized protein n=1 Tax=Borborobacter arsenicus TaxID=1851146 RepID=A0A432VA24_9HYPH|nr:hypothetical protein [Pseudaminobacter arsenicus]RUM98994.1 hypothetical protein EET67_04965 [Pseudaminobacter arsenicus]